jgi:hypothetical protein
MSANYCGKGIKILGYKSTLAFWQKFGYDGGIHLGRKRKRVEPFYAH